LARELYRYSGNGCALAVSNRIDLNQLSNAEFFCALAESIDLT
jgi:hypothetical protein